MWGVADERRRGDGEPGADKAPRDRAWDTAPVAMR